MLGSIVYFVVDKFFANRRIEETVMKERENCKEKQLAVEQANFEDFTHQLMTLVTKQTSEDIVDEDFKDVSKYFQLVVQSTKLVKLLFVDELGIVKASNDRSMVGDSVNKQYDSQVLAQDRSIHFIYDDAENLVTLRMQDEKELLGHLIMHYQDEAVGVRPH